MAQFPMRILLVLLSVFCVTHLSWAQPEASKATELGITLGASSFLGELGGSADVGRALVQDIDLAATRPAAGIFFRWNPNNRLGWRFNAYYTQVFGDDALGGATDPAQPGFPRVYRNLSFRSNIAELSTNLEINLLPYVVGSERFRFTPYVTFGVGGAYFDPRARYQGEWIRLQPLGTEGQNLPQYPEKEEYSLLTAVFPVGAGIKFNFNDSWAMTFEVSHRFTTTDYIDDVSGTYANPTYFYEEYDAATADMVAALADRSSGEFPGRTAPGEQRGDPSDFDGYTFIGLFSLSYALKTRGNTQYYCPKFF